MLKKSGIGIAFDIGTTTIAGARVELASGSVVGTAAALNPQAQWGSDIISRIEAAVKSPLSLKEMSASVVGACNGLIKELGGGDILEVITAGNSVMEHLLLNISPEPLSKVPYKPAFVEAKRLKAYETGFDVPEEAGLYVFPLIGGFVGGDAVAVALHLGLHKAVRPALAVDIGTNSEILLAAGGELFATSAAAGPAFEGGGIRQGMSAQRGAIERVRIEDEGVAIDCVGGAPPRGICGSGLVDAVSGLLKAGIIDRTGRIKNRGEVTTNLANRILEASEGNAFILYRGASNTVALDQNDIRALQTAKSAIRAGIEMLLKKAKVKSADIEKVFIAGAFGSHLEKEGLRMIGILDSSWLDKVEIAGDAALDGAVLALDDEKKHEAGDLAASCRYVSLSGSAHFEREFIKNMDFRI